MIYLNENNTFFNFILHYSSSQKKILQNLKNYRSKYNLVQKRLRAIKLKTRRLQKKVSNMGQIISDLRNKNLISEDALAVLEKSCSKVSVNIMRRALSNAETLKKGKKLPRNKIPEDIRSFALTLQFYSTKAYSYVRNTFNLALPSLSTMRSWMSNVHCEPGYCENSFRSLSVIAAENVKSGKKTLCALMLDEMAIKKQIEFRANRTWGYEDCGVGIKDDSLKCATEALVLLVVSVDGSWKIPVAYFLINSLTGAEKANIVKQGLKKLHEVGVTVASVTCDGPSAHFTMAKHLGANVDDILNLKPYFEHPFTKSNVYIIFDACHMLKLVRNNWAKCRVFINSKGQTIDYKYIEMLHHIQEEEKCSLGNRLRKGHIDWRRQKMKVFLFKIISLTIIVMNICF